MSIARQELLEILARQSFRLGDFKLSSGSSSDYYIDCRTTTLDARGAQLTGEVFLEAIREQSWEPEAIGGLTMGADPVVVLSDDRSASKKIAGFALCAGGLLRVYRNWRRY